jgi:hypothetical protein
MSYSGVSRYDFGSQFGIAHGDKPKAALAESLAFPTDLDVVAIRLDAAAREAIGDQ